MSAPITRPPGWVRGTWKGALMPQGAIAGGQLIGVHRHNSAAADLPQIGRRIEGCWEGRGVLPALQPMCDHPRRFPLPSSASLRAPRAAIRYHRVLLPFLPSPGGPQRVPRL